MPTLWRMKGTPRDDGSPEPDENATESEQPVQAEEDGKTTEQAFKVIERGLDPDGREDSDDVPADLSL